MDSSKLADRLRGILKAPLPRADPAEDPRPSGVEGKGTGTDIERVLGGQWCRVNDLSCFVVEQRRAPETMYGGQPVQTIATALSTGAAEAPLLAAGAPARVPFVFFDLETTGLSGGAGTYAFLVGLGRFDETGGFVTRQFVLVRPPDERHLLQVVAAELEQAGTLVSFNGKSFDAPLIETRHLFHRLEWTGGRLPHMDILHAARRFWSNGGSAMASCSLGALETQVLGARRMSDVPGFEIPSRYYQFVRTGEAGPLAAVLEHNRLDLLSLAGLTARLLDLVRIGPDAARHAREALALGRVYARGGLDGRACEAYQRALVMGSLSDDGLVDALRSLALLSRRARRYDDAAACWGALLEVVEAPPHVAREASEALAIHHEHRARDLHAARAFALRSLDGPDEGRRTAWNQAVRHRLARIAKKMGATVQPGLFPSLPSRPSSGFPMSARRISS